MIDNFSSQSLERNNASTEGLPSDGGKFEMFLSAVEGLLNPEGPNFLADIANNPIYKEELLTHLGKTYRNEVADRMNRTGCFIPDVSNQIPDEEAGTDIYRTAQEIAKLRGIKAMYTQKHAEMTKIILAGEKPNTSDILELLAAQSAWIKVAEGVQRGLLEMYDKYTIHGTFYTFPDGSRLPKKRYINQPGYPPTEEEIAQIKNHASNGNHFIGVGRSAHNVFLAGAAVTMVFSSATAVDPSALLSEVFGDTVTNNGMGVEFPGVGNDGEPDENQQGPNGSPQIVHWRWR